MTESKSNYCVYVYMDPRNSPPTPFYVGKGRPKRPYQKHGNQKFLMGFIKNLEKDNLKHVVVIVEKNLTNQEALGKEQELIEVHGCKYDNSGCLLNMTKGGVGGEGAKRTAETKALMSQQRKGKKQTPAQYAANCARIATEEHKAKISAAQKGIVRMTPEQYKAIAEKNRGRKASPELIQKFSEMRKGIPKTPEQNEATGAGVRRHYERKKAEFDDLPYEEKVAKLEQRLARKNFKGKPRHKVMAQLEKIKQDHQSSSTSQSSD